MESGDGKERGAASGQRTAVPASVPLRGGMIDSSLESTLLAAIHSSASQPGLMSPGSSSMMSELHGLAQPNQPLLQQQPTPEAVTAAAAATWAFMQQAMAAGSGTSLVGAPVTSGRFPPAPPPPPPPPPPSQRQVNVHPASQVMTNNQALQSKPVIEAAKHPLAGAATYLSNPIAPSSNEAVSTVSSESTLPTAPGNGRSLHSFTVESKRRRTDSVSDEPTKARKSAASAASVDASTDPSFFSFDNLVPPKPKSDAEVAKMTPAERRRYERNLREQQRSYRISQQIKELRDVLADSNVHFKPNKFSILVSVTEYIKQLQSRAIMLDAEHQKLITTISQSGDLPIRPPAAHSSSSEDSERDPARHPQQSAAVAGPSGNDQDLLMVRGIDYESVFGRCPFALGVASLDGRVLACNEALERLLGCTRREMMEQSLFLFIRNHQEVFEAMADLLKRSSLGAEAGELPSDTPRQLLFWCGNILAQSERKLHFTITLTTSADSNPKYFSFAASPVSTSPVS